MSETPRPIPESTLDRLRLHPDLMEVYKRHIDDDPLHLMAAALTRVVELRELRESDLHEISVLIDSVRYELTWDAARIDRLNLPIERVPIGYLAAYIDEPYMSRMGDEELYITPRQVINDSMRFKEEYERLLSINTFKPIDIIQDGNNWIIIEGLDRLISLRVQGHNYVEVRKIPKNMIECSHE